MQTLEVVNQMLGTMGESPLASLEEPHEFKGAAVNLLEKENRILQSRGWWFNMECMTVAPMVNGRILLAGDIIEVRTKCRTIVQRGQYLYDLKNGTDIFTKSVELTAIRVIPFANVPESASDYIGWSATLKFQVLYDGDTARTRSIEQSLGSSYTACHTIDIRNKQANMIEANPRLMQLRVRNQAIPRW